MADSLTALEGEIVECRACPRLVQWREQVARDKRAAFADQQYWGRPVPGWGPADPAIFIVGLAPAAHGGNRTGRIFTGDRSGDWLFASLYRAGLARSPVSIGRDDGNRLIAARMAAAVRCAPPQNRPTVAERDRCAPFLTREVALVASTLRVIVALGGFAWHSALHSAAELGWSVPRPRPAFGHGAEAVLANARPTPAGSVLLLGSYHPSQQNTFTGKLTEPMLDAVLATAVASAQS